LCVDRSGTGGQSERETNEECFHCGDETTSSVGVFISFNDDIRKNCACDVTPDVALRMRTNLSCSGRASGTAAFRLSTVPAAATLPKWRRSVHGSKRL
jgi:hypothetical protein